ncbi:hypothetical protein [Streptomyces virginiae]|uniref:hypothetical protein n=1 Tax=Streptomyces virginiae TaxID=1961 RepID=UPI0022582055|nr:hypothetical protein [Streptomyces virginiae]MCX4961235.1 hypothetical protein [Streptomyces virginiae]
MLAAARSHSFAQLAGAIDVAFGRWDLAHLHMSTLADGTGVSPLEWWDGAAPDATIDGQSTKLSRLVAGEQFAYIFGSSALSVKQAGQWAKRMRRRRRSNPARP